MGYSIIVGASLVRFPQVIKLFMNKSSEGILPEMYYIDNYMMIIVGCYNIHLKNPFSVYGENFLILVQNIAIVILIWTYNKEVKLMTKILNSVAVCILFFILFTDTFVTEGMWIFMINIQFILLTIARAPQIWHNYKQGSTGQLAFITFLLNTLGGLARLLTLLKETSDLLNFISTILAFAFNLILTLQIIIYWNSSSKSKVKVEEGPEEPIIEKKNSESNTRRRTRID